MSKTGARRRASTKEQLVLVYRTQNEESATRVFGIANDEELGAALWRELGEIFTGPDPPELAVVILRDCGKGAASFRLVNYLKLLIESSRDRSYAPVWDEGGETAGALWYSVEGLCELEATARRDLPRENWPSRWLSCYSDAVQEIHRQDPNRAKLDELLLPAAVGTVMQLLDRLSPDELIQVAAKASALHQQKVGTPLSLPGTLSQEGQRRSDRALEASGYLKAAQAADIIGVNQSRIRQLARSGELGAVKSLENNWWVLPSEAERMASLPRKSGPKSTATS